MLKEAIRLWPRCYFIIQSYNLDFENLLMLTLHYLPKIKFCMYPEDETLGGPFLYTPWDILGKRLCARPSISIDYYLAYVAHIARAALPL